MSIIPQLKKKKKHAFKVTCAEIGMDAPLEPKGFKPWLDARVGPQRPYLIPHWTCVTN